MKRFWLILLALLWTTVMLTGCEKDSIIWIDPIEDDVTVIDVDYSMTVDVVFSASGTATVSGTNDDFDVTINGNDVTIVYSGDSIVMYALSGSASDGFFKLYSSSTQGVTLNNLTLTHQSGAAINIQGPKSEPNDGSPTYLIVKGSNTLADGSSYTATPANEDEKAAVFSEGPLVFSGNGSLAVNATGKSGIISDEFVYFRSSPTIEVSSSAGHGIRGKDYVVITGGALDVSVSADMKKGIGSDGYVQIDGGTTTIQVTGNAAYDNEGNAYSGSAGIKADGYFKMNGGTLTITNTGIGGKGINCDGAGYFNGGNATITVTGSDYTTGDISAKGIKTDGNLMFSGSTVTVNCTHNEGIESKGTITISDGVVYSYSASDDAINSGSTFTISGGYVYAYAPNNDGMDANGNFYITGGVVYAIGARTPEVAIDANTEEGYKLYVQGGTLVAIGGLERGSSLTQSCYSANSWTPNTWYSLKVGSETYAFKTPASGGTPLVVSGSSTPTLKSGVSVSGGNTLFNGMFVEDGTVSGGTTVSLSSYTGGNGGGPGVW
ncbi:MAG: carbohydrate-binding domain-containing protein [Bacteroidales bacterium]|nr:carbohydrate-binding domain-containing protein [Bacteroidales bacterium]